MAKNDFGSILEQFEKRNHVEDEKILLEKGDRKVPSAVATVNSLRRMLPEREMDLHGFIADTAAERAVSFIKTAKKDGLSKVAIIVGKGLHSDGGNAVLPAAVKNAVMSTRLVREIQTPSERYGGSGTFWIILKN